MVSDMRLCAQTPGQSILEHGESVARYFDDLVGLRLLAWRLPTWFDESLKVKLLPADIIHTYQVYHDCGKPYCLTVDESGRRHYPNHAGVSAQVWRAILGDEQVAHLMSMDMDIHTIKAKDVPRFASRPEAITLLLTGLAEIHSNADMFGGLDSTNFKIKWKQIDSRGRAVLKGDRENDSGVIFSE